MLGVEEGFCWATPGNIILGGAADIFVGVVSAAAQQYPDPHSSSKKIIAKPVKDDNFVIWVFHG